MSYGREILDESAWERYGDPAREKHLPKSEQRPRPQVVTNETRVRDMNSEDFQNFIAGVVYNCPPGKSCVGGHDPVWCGGCWIDWLREEVKG